MAILFCDSMNSYGSTSDLSKMWGSNPTAAITVDLTAGPSADPVIKLTAGTSSAFLVTSLYAQPAGTMLGGRFKFKASAVPGASTALLAIGNINSAGAATSSSWSIGPQTATGKIGCGIAGSATVTTFVGSTNVCDNAYHVIEFQVDARDSPNGSIKVWVDGVLEINQTGIDAFSGTAHATRSWDTDMVLTSLASGATVRYVKDIVIWDSAGVAGNLRTADQPFGNIVIATLRPSGAGTTTQFTPSAGSNFQCVDEVAQDGNTTYVEDTVSGHRDLYAMGNLGLSPTTVYGVVAKIFATNPGSLSISMKQTLKSNVTTTANTATVTNLIGDYKTQVYDLDPDINAVWTGTTVDAVEQGFEVA